MDPITKNRGHIIEKSDDKIADKTIHLGKKPKKGGSPANDRIKINNENVYAGVMIEIDILGDQWLDERNHKRNIIAAVVIE